VDGAVLPETCPLPDWQPVKKATASIATKQLAKYGIKRFVLCIIFLWVVRLII
jgi:hypothetical protein